VREPRFSNIRFVRKDPSSGQNGCPARYEVDGGQVVVGKVMTAAEVAMVRAEGAAQPVPVGIADDEIAVFVPAGTLDP
jgi:hypothetical protein